MDRANQVEAHAGLLHSACGCSHRLLYLHQGGAIEVASALECKGAVGLLDRFEFLSSSCVDWAVLVKYAGGFDDDGGFDGVHL